eukprot:365146-Chlamydomonas_euryale.AAC.2
MDGHTLHRGPQRPTQPVATAPQGASQRALGPRPEALTLMFFMRPPAFCRMSRRRTASMWNAHHEFHAMTRRRFMKCLPARSKRMRRRRRSSLRLNHAVSMALMRRRLMTMMGRSSKPRTFFSSAKMRESRASMAQDTSWSATTPRHPSKQRRRRPRQMVACSLRRIAQFLSTTPKRSFHA